jgi:thiamine monophosphate kinase
MTYKGRARGRLIELEEALPYSEGQRISVSVNLLDREAELGTPSIVLQAMRAPPHLDPADVNEFERAIEAGRMPVRHEGTFDPGTTQRRSS